MGEMMPFSPGQRTLLRRCGAAILFVGICSGAFIYWSAPQRVDASNSEAVYDDSPLVPDDSRRYAHDTEMNFGKVGGLVDKWMRLAARWSEPKPLAITIIVVSVLISGGCFVLARPGRAASR
jgi:hypothetical protein